MFYTLTNITACYVSSHLSCQHFLGRVIVRFVAYTYQYLGVLLVCVHTLSPCTLDLLEIIALQYWCVLSSLCNNM